MEAGQVRSRAGEPIYAGTGGDQQLAKTEMSPTIGFDRTAIDIDPAHASFQMDADLAVPVKRLVMDQDFSLVRTIEEKSLRQRRSVVGRVVSAHTIATLPSAPAARKVSAAVALANPPPSNRKSTKGISFECIWFRPFKITQDMGLSGITLAAGSGPAVAQSCTQDFCPEYSFAVSFPAAP